MRYHLLMHSPAMIRAAWAVFLLFPATGFAGPDAEANPAADTRMVMTSAEPDGTRDPSWVRDRAYSAAGIGFLRCLAGIRYPSSGPFGERRPLDFRVDWAAQAKDNAAGYPYCDWTALDYGTGPAVIYTAFNVRYLAGSKEWFDYYFEKMPALRYIKRTEVAKIVQNERAIRDQSMAFFMCFSPRKTRFAYYPGDLLFHGGETMRDPWLAATPEAIRNGTHTAHKIFGDTTGLLAIINGTFIHHDNYTMYDRDGFRYGGFGWDFRTIAEPRPEMATCAIYEDGAMKLGSWQNLPDKARIRMFVQNKFMILENGRWGRDASPPHYTRFADMIARSYLFRHETGVFGYAWTCNLPPQIASKLAFDAGISDMMLLDIHSPISCQVSLPGRTPMFRDWQDFKARSFNFVPVFDDQSAVVRSLVSLSRAMEKGVQFDYRREAFVRGEKDHFAVFLADAPEAARLSRPRPVEVSMAGTRGRLEE